MDAFDEVCEYCGNPDPTGFECCQDCADTLAELAEWADTWD